MSFCQPCCLPLDAFKDLKIHFILWSSRSACNIQSKATSVLNRWGESPPWISWLCCVQCTPKCSLSTCPPLHTAGSRCHWHPQGHSSWDALQPFFSQSVPASIPVAEPGIFLCWNSCYWSYLIFQSYLDPSDPSRVNTTTQFSIISKPAKDALSFCI